MNTKEFKASGINPLTKDSVWNKDNFTQSLEDIRRYADIKDPITSLSEVFRGLMKAGELADREVMKTKVITLAGEAGMATEISKQRYIAIQNMSNRRSGTVESVDNLSVVIVNGKPRYILAAPEITSSIRIIENLTPETQGFIINGWQSLITKTKRAIVAMPDFMLRNFTRDIQDRFIRGSKPNFKTDLTLSEANAVNRLTGGSTEGYYMPSSEEYLAHMDEMLGLVKQGKVSMYMGWLRKMSGKVEETNRGAEFANASSEMTKRLDTEGNSELKIKSDAELEADANALSSQPTEKLNELLNDLSTEDESENPLLHSLTMAQRDEFLKEAYVDDASRINAINILWNLKRDFKVGTVSNKYGSYMARNLMDFAKGGKTTKYLDKNWVPFLNPSTQGLIRTLKYAKSHPTMAFARFSAVILLPRFLAAFINKANGNEAEYKDLPTWRREAGINIKVGNHWLYITQPFENAVFGGIAERLIYSAIDHNVESNFVGIKPSDLVLNLLGGSDSTVLGPMKAIPEIMFNQSTLTGAKIIPANQAELKVSERTQSYSGVGTDHPKIVGGTETASLGSKLIGKVLPMDPKAIDYFISNQFGGLGKFVVGLQTGKYDRQHILNTLANNFGLKDVAGHSSAILSAAYDQIYGYGLNKNDPMITNPAYQVLQSQLDDHLKTVVQLRKEYKDPATIPARKTAIVNLFRAEGTMLYAIGKQMIAIKHPAPVQPGKTTLGPKDSEGFQEVKTR